MSRKPAFIKSVNIEDGMPTVEEALRRLERELSPARAAKVTALRVIHGYGSSGVGGALRVAIQLRLRELQQSGTIQEVIYGEDWRISDEASWKWLQRYPEWKKDSDLGRQNKGISIVIL
ncbi:MAG TPA: Smr/MutS family protein [Terriglobales bacterium]|nr:Smr/MutS family protein [Terriglobales bacterium]